jgi:hypothetical protein
MKEEYPRLVYLLFLKPGRPDYSIAAQGGQQKKVGD